MLTKTARKNLDQTVARVAIAQKIGDPQKRVDALVRLENFVGEALYRTAVSRWAANAWFAAEPFKNERAAEFTTNSQYVEMYKP